MKKVTKVLLVLMIGSFLIGCQKVNKEKVNEKDYFQSIYIKKDNDCNKELELYYTDYNNVKYYSMCLTEITLKFNDKEMDLKEALKTDSTIMDKILDKLTITDVAMDGGTTIYKDFGYSNVAYSDVGNTGFTIIKCNAMQGNITESLPNNNDYYFGDVSLKYEDGYCSNK